MNLTSKIAALQDYREYEELNWSGTFEDYLKHRPREPQGHAHRLPARLRHDPVATGRKSTSTTRRSSSATTSSRTSSTAGATPSSASTSRSCSWSTCFKIGGAALRHREARHPAARPGRLVEVDHRAPAQEGHRGVLAHARGRALHLSTGCCPRSCAHITGGHEIVHVARCTRSRCASSRAEWRDERVQRARPRQRAATRSTSRAISNPACRLHLPRADAPLQRRLVAR